MARLVSAALVALALVLAGLPARAQTAVGSSAVPTGYVGECDIGPVACAEAYSLTHIMTRNYSGPLFQVVLAANPTGGSLTIYAGSNGMANTSGLSGFGCSTPSNCIVSRIYAQINTGGGNDLLPVGTWDCSSAWACAAPLALNATTGLPEITVGKSSYKYALLNDGTLTGVNGGVSDVSVLVSGNTGTMTVPNCCEPFGLAHLWNGGDTPGQDFMIGPSYGTGGTYMDCPTASTYCMGIDLEINWFSGCNLGSSPSEIIMFANWSSRTNYTLGATNGKTCWYAPQSNMHYPGLHMRLGGGGDLTQNAIMIFRDGMLFNGVVGVPQYYAIMQSLEARYPGLTFPQPN